MAEALVGIGMFSTIAGATAFVTYTQYALVIYGLYNGYREKQKAKNAYDASLTDRSISISTTDVPRSIVYGRRIVGGTPAYIVDARDNAETPAEAAIKNRPARPANPYFYFVLALEPDHEVDSIEAILFDNKNIGPMQSDPNLMEGLGVYVSNRSPFYRSVYGVTTHSGTVDANGRIFPPFRIEAVLTLAVSNDENLPSGNPTSIGDTFDLYPGQPQYTIEAGNSYLQIDAAAHAGHGFVLTYKYAVDTPLIRAWYYHGRDPATNPEISLANDTLKTVSAGEWTSNCRGFGIPYVIVEVKPDIDFFPNGLPTVTVRVRGKKCLSMTGGAPEYSENPAVHLYDYLRTELDLPDSAINLPLLIATKNACDQQIIAGWEPISVGAPTRLPDPIFEARYKNHLILSTDASRLDNLRIILSSMAGTMTWANGKFDIRCGAPIYDISPVSLDDSDLADGNITVKPEPDLFDGYNCVRGRYANELQNYVITDLPPYKSPKYISEDRLPGQTTGGEAWMENDLPGVTSALQGQRINLLLLRLSRNALTYTGKYKEVLSAISAGQIVNISNETFGWDNKPFHLTKKQRQEDGTFDTVWTEAALPIYDPLYTEMSMADPSPNTGLKPASDVAQPSELRFFSGPEYATYNPDGTINAYVLVEWDRLPPETAYGGRIELLWKYAEEVIETRAPSLLGDATSYRIPITSRRQISVRVRAMNAAQVYGPWREGGYYADNVPTGYVMGNMLANPEFAHVVQVATPNLLIPNWYGIYSGANPYTFVNLYPQPIPFTVPKPDGTSFSSYQGFMGVDDPDGDYLVLNVFSEYFKVAHGKRLVAYASHWSAYGRGQIGLQFIYNDQVFDTWYSEIAPPRGIPYDDGTGLNQYQKISMFFDIPDNNLYSAMHVRLVLTDHREPTTPNGTPTTVRWYQPLVGYATPGQFQLPPWSK